MLIRYYKQILRLKDISSGGLINYILGQLGHVPQGPKLLRAPLKFETQNKNRPQKQKII